MRGDLCGSVPAALTGLLPRLVAEVLEQQLGRLFVVENPPGSGAVIATARSPEALADG